MYSPQKPADNDEISELNAELRSRRQARAAKRLVGRDHLDPYVAAASVLVDFDPEELIPLDIVVASQLGVEKTTLGNLLPRAYRQIVQTQYAQEPEAESEKPDERAQPGPGNSLTVEQPPNLLPRTYSLWKSCQVIVRDGKTRWALRNDSRMEALRFLASRSYLEMALETNAQTNINGEDQRIFANIIRGKWDYALLSGPTQIAAALQAAQWLKGVVPNLPDTLELTNRLSRARFLAPFEALAGSGFSGRELELQKLNNFVGVQELDSLRELGTSALRGWLLKPKVGPLIVYGVGGVGKSSLISKFILTHEGASLAFSRFPITYIDFDNSCNSLIRSESICLEAARQLSSQYPLLRELYRQMITDLEQSEGQNRLRFDGIAVEGIESYGDTAITSLSNVDDADIADFQRSIDFWKKWFPQIAAAVANGPVSKKSPPFLMVFDTFEEVISRNRLGVSLILHLVEQIQLLYPALRPVISGRALDRSFGDDLKRAFDTLKIDEFDPDAARAYLLKQGLQNRELAATIVTQVGRSPLSLKLAAQAILRGEAASVRSGFSNLRTTSWLLFSASETVVQGQLYQRILAHIANLEVRKLAYPGLVLRRITPDLIRLVLAKPCELNFPSDEGDQEGTANALFEELRNEFSLVATQGENAVRLSNEVRRVILSMIEGERPAQVAEIHRAAVSYYSTHGSSPEDRAEEIYHRLKLGEDTSTTLSSRWLSDCGRFLEDSVPEMSPSIQLTLASYIGLKLPNEKLLLKAANLEDWERITERRIHEGLATKQKASELLELLDERSERSDISPLYLAKAKVFLANSDPKLAIVELRRGADAMASVGAKRALLTILQELATALTQVSQFNEARQTWLDVVKLSRELALPVSAFNAAFQMLSLVPKDSESAMLLGDTMRSMSDSDWREAGSAIRAAIILLGPGLSLALAKRTLDVVPELAGFLQPAIRSVLSEIESRKSTNLGYPTASGAA